MLIAPSPTEKNMPPARQSSACRGVASRGVSDGIIIKSSIPTPRDRQIASHDFCFAITLISRKMEINTGIRKIFESIQNKILTALNPFIVKGKLETAPPIIAPMKNAINIALAPTKVVTVLEIT